MPSLPRCLFWIGCAALLAACGEWKTDRQELTSVTAALLPGPDCSSCHAYVLQDSNHLFHLYTADSSKLINGPVTCLDCHSTSIAYNTVALADSIFRDPQGATWSSLDYPKSQVIRAYPLLRVDTVRQHRPVPAPPRPGEAPGYQEYVTALAHCNGVVDVAFDARVSDTANFSGSRATYNPKEQTCSAIYCHERVNPYRWGAPSKGLPGLIGN